MEDSKFVGVKNCLKGCRKRKLGLKTSNAAFSAYFNILADFVYAEL